MIHRRVPGEDPPWGSGCQCRSIVANPARFGALSAGLRHSRGVDSHASGTLPSLLRMYRVARSMGSGFAAASMANGIDMPSIGHDCLMCHSPSGSRVPCPGRVSSALSCGRKARDLRVWPPGFCHSLGNLLNAAMAAPLGSGGRRRRSQVGSRRLISAAAPAARPRVRRGGRGGRGMAASGSDGYRGSGGSSGHCLSSRLQV
jgi:hypothetical protein